MFVVVAVSTFWILSLLCNMLETVCVMFDNEPVMQKGCL